VLLDRVQRLDHRHRGTRGAPATAEQQEPAQQGEQGCEAGRSENPGAWIQAHDLPIGIPGRSLDGENTKGAVSRALRVER
jgi:hypothetical protein